MDAELRYLSVRIPGDAFRWLDKGDAGGSGVQTKRPEVLTSGGSLWVPNAGPCCSYLCGVGPAMSAHVVVNGHRDGSDTMWIGGHLTELILPRICPPKNQSTTTRTFLDSVNGPSERFASENLSRPAYPIGIEHARAVIPLALMHVASY